MLDDTVNNVHTNYVMNTTNFTTRYTDNSSHGEGVRKIITGRILLFSELCITGAPDIKFNVNTTSSAVVKNEIN